MEKLRGDVVLWLDEEARTGAEHMAVDEWLLSRSAAPVLRIYQWPEGFGSIGYFCNLTVARCLYPDIRFVRRRTGGGIVDHRNDWTYSLVVPRGEPLATARGGESYETIHLALSRTLAAEGVETLAHAGGANACVADCFLNPVPADLLNSYGRKIAGAAQWRSSGRLLHQGSVAMPCDAGKSVARSRRLLSELAPVWHAETLAPSAAVIADIAARRYDSPEWANRR